MIESTILTEFTSTIQEMFTHLSTSAFTIITLPFTASTSATTAGPVPTTATTPTANQIANIDDRFRGDGRIIRLIGIKFIVQPFANSSDLMSSVHPIPFPFHFSFHYRWVPSSVARMPVVRFHVICISARFLFSSFLVVL